jgi:two-component system, OmpR family, alkaline phosphatase synthesis response regulator PhoP
MKPLILLVEDEEHLARGLRFNFEAEGYRCTHFDRGDTALDWLLSPVGDDVDLVVLDVMLSGVSGLEILHRLREAERTVPVLMLTARDGESDVVRGLDMGADDYLTKPFSLPVLLARVRTLLRRGARTEEPAVPARFSVGDAIVYPDRFEIERAGDRLPVTAKELGLLQLLYARRGSAVSRGEILHEVWDLHPNTRTRVVDTFVRRLRKLIEPDPSAPRFLLSVRTYGYKLVTGDDRAAPTAAT